MENMNTDRVRAGDRGTLSLWREDNVVNIYYSQDFVMVYQRLVFGCDH